MRSQKVAYSIKVSYNMGMVEQAKIEGLNIIREMSTTNLGLLYFAVHGSSKDESKFDRDPTRPSDFDFLAITKVNFKAATKLLPSFRNHERFSFDDGVSLLTKDMPGKRHIDLLILSERRLDNILNILKSTAGGIILIREIVVYGDAFINGLVSGETMYDERLSENKRLAIARLKKLNTPELQDRIESTRKTGLDLSTPLPKPPPDF